MLQRQLADEFMESFFKKIFTARKQANKMAAGQ